MSSAMIVSWYATESVTTGPPRVRGSSHCHSSRRPRPCPACHRRRPDGVRPTSLSQRPEMRDNHKRADGVRSPGERGISMKTSRSGREAGIESAVLDLGDVPLSELRTLDGSELRKALRHAAE